MRSSAFRTISLGLMLLAVACGARTSSAAEQVSFPSGNKTLHGLIFKPAGSGPFPTVLYNHGSAPGLLNNEAFARIAPVFTAHGWAFFAPYRRGQGLSSDAGAYIGTEIAAASARGGASLAARTTVKLLTTEQLQDQMAALAWLRRQPFVRQGEIAVMGNSFGGIEAVLGAARGDYCAAVDASGGAESWSAESELREVMLRAVQASMAPIFFFQARNDYNLAPSRTLYGAARRAGRRARMRIYPPYGDTPAAGHSFAWRGAKVWGSDVLRFVDRNCLERHVAPRK
ncbi:MAG TPA: dienelactone hydrolase family protein [Steroidobacteraceae bacterium]